LYRKLCAVEAFLAGTLLVLMVALIFLGGVSRVLGYPLNWSTDFATAFFAWACFLCADCRGGCRRGRRRPAGWRTTSSSARSSYT
jgi:hypothetical protein